MSKLTHWKIAQADHYSLLVLDIADQSQNVLSSDVVNELGKALEQIQSTTARALIIDSAKSDNFISGADIREFQLIESSEQAESIIAKAHDILNRLSSLNIPTVAMINGHCLGGGLELALACDYRVISDDPSIRLGLPEVKLGIHPGFGGTVRLIERIGAVAAMDLMLSGRTVVPKVARKMGIVDMAVPKRQLLRAAELMISKRPSTKQAGGWKRLISHSPFREMVSGYLHKQVSAKAREEHYPAPFELIRLWKKYGGNKDEMLIQEQTSVAHLITTETSRNLVKVFFLQEHLKQLAKSAKATSKFEHIHVIGAGVMGGDIASWCAYRGLTVTIQDQNPEALARANQRAYQFFKKKLRQPRLIELAMDRFIPDLSGIGVGKADVIVEAIFENADAKMSVFKEVEKNARPEALLATNTSSIPLETIATALEKPGRLVGLHFFNPVAKMQLIEVVKGIKTQQKSVGNATAFAGRINRLPAVVNSSPGFLVNRILMPYLLEAVELYREKIPAPLIDKAAKKFGMPIGPIELADTVGLDICLHVAENLIKHVGGELPEALKNKVDAGQLGKKSGRGFYKWEKGRARKKAVDSDIKPRDLTDRLIFRYLNECVECLYRGIISNAVELDAGLIFGTGFAPFKAGPIQHIVDQGQSAMLEKLSILNTKYGERFQPSEGWTKLNLAEIRTDTR